MFSSSPSSTRQSDSTIEKGLRHAVRQVYKSGNLENLTVKRVRKTVESDLDLEEDFFKTDASWASKSKLVIQAEVDAQAETGETSSLPTLSQRPTSPPKPQNQHRKPRGTKRASTEKAGPKKRRKKQDSEAEDSAREEGAPQRISAACSKAEPRSSKRDDSGAEVTASEAEGIRAESDLEDDVEEKVITGAKRKGNGTTKSDPRRHKSELDSADNVEEEEEEEDVKPAKWKRNGKKDERGLNNRITKKLSSTEKAPEKPAAKIKAVQRSSSSVFSEPEEAEDITPNVHSANSPSDDLAEQSHSDSELSELIDEPSKAKGSRTSKKTEPKSKQPEPAKPEEPSEQPEDSEPTKAEQSDSSMSILIDEPPKPKRNRKSSSAPPASKNTKPTKSKKPTDGPSDPDLEEIKRLQGQLVKCGIRKMWHKELSPYPTAKSKIKHLKEMLSDAGMKGRFSEAKGEQIREERELRADLEAVQEGERKWGKVDEDGGGAGAGAGPKRRLARGFEGLDFLNDDGEETD